MFRKEKNKCLSASVSVRGGRKGADKMKPKNIFVMTAALCCLMFLVESCSSSVLVDVWSDPSYDGPPLKKIFIIAVRKDPVQRRIWEDAFASELANYDIKATSSYQLFPNSLPDTTQIIQSIQDRGFDGILITRLLLSETKTYTVASSITTERITRYNFFRRTYDTYYHDVLHPGYTESYVIDRRAIDVWVIKNEEKMIWSATSNSPERNSMQAVQIDIADLVMPELLRSSIIDKKSK